MCLSCTDRIRFLHIVDMLPPPFEMHLEAEDWSGSADVYYIYIYIMYDIYICIYITLLCVFNNLGFIAITEIWDIWLQFHHMDWRMSNPILPPLRQQPYSKFFWVRSFPALLLSLCIVQQYAQGFSGQREPGFIAWDCSKYRNWGLRAGIQDSPFASKCFSYRLLGC